MILTSPPDEVLPHIPEETLRMVDDASGNVLCEVLSISSLHPSLKVLSDPGDKRVGEIVQKKDPDRT